MSFQTKIPHEISGVAFTLFHYYTYFKPFTEIKTDELSMACLFIAGKIQLQLLPTQELIDKFKSINNKRSEIKPDFLKYEIEIFSFLGYDLEIQTPYLFLNKFLKTTKAKLIQNHNDLPVVVYNIINDSYRKSLCLYFHPHNIMMASLLLGIKYLKKENVINIVELLKGEETDKIVECMGYINDIYKNSIIDKNANGSK